MIFTETEICIEACLNCASKCHDSSNFILTLEENPILNKCAQLNMECAAVCTATAVLLSLKSENARQFCRVCADLCSNCEKECSKINTMYSRECAYYCKICKDECMKMHAFYSVYLCNLN